MSEKRKSNFRNKTVGDAKDQKKRASSRGYLSLPKDMKAYVPTEDERTIYLDFIPYEVKVENHPDRYDPEERAMPDTLWYKRPFKVHKSIGADEETVVCPKSIKKKCPICEYIAKQLKDGVDWDDLKDSMAKDRNLYAVIPIDSEEHEKDTIYIWDVSYHLFQNELIDHLEEDEDNGIFPDLEEGKTLKITLKWKKYKKATFAETRAISFESRDAYEEDILDEVPDLDTLLIIKTYQELSDQFFDMEGEEVVSEEVVVESAEVPEEKPARRRRKTVEKETESKVEPKAEPEPEPTPKRTRKPKEQTSDNECPHGHRFGTDCEEKDECGDCDSWDKCIEKQ